MGYRRKARECALQMLFQLDMSQLSAARVRALYWKEHPQPDPIREYADEIVIGAAEDQERIDTLIQQVVSNWRLERVATVDRNLLRMAVYELLHQPETPRNAIINEAIEIAKKFGADDSAQFVNGVLDAIKREIEAVAPPGP